MMKTVRMNHLL